MADQLDTVLFDGTISIKLHAQPKQQMMQVILNNIQLGRIAFITVSRIMPSCSPVSRLVSMPVTVLLGAASFPSFKAASIPSFKSLAIAPDPLVLRLKPVEPGLDLGLRELAGAADLGGSGGASETSGVVSVPCGCGIVDLGRNEISVPSEALLKLQGYFPQRFPAAQMAPDLFLFLVPEHLRAHRGSAVKRFAVFDRQGSH